MNRFIRLAVMSIGVASAMAEPGEAQGVRRGIPAAPTSRQSYWDRRLPLPPTPGGPLPNTTFRWPFEVLPYYYQPPMYESSPYARYLQSYTSYAPYDIAPMPDIPSYSPPPYQDWPNNLPLY